MQSTTKKAAKQQRIKAAKTARKSDVEKRVARAVSRLELKQKRGVENELRRLQNLKSRGGNLPARLQRVAENTVE